jgi:hypothetical protein
MGMVENVPPVLSYFARPFVFISYFKYSLILVTFGTGKKIYLASALLIALSMVKS